MIVADVSFIDIFWSMLEFFFLFIWIIILFHVLGDLFRDHSLSGVTKTLWVLFLVFLPYYPFWALIVIALDVFVIWALTAHGHDVQHHNA